MTSEKPSLTPHDIALLNQSLAQLQTLLNPQPIFGDFSHQDTLFESCQLVGQQLQLHFKHPPQEPSPQLSIDEQIHQICLHSQIYFRKIRLPDDWWKTFHEPFVGWDKDTNQPVALLFDFRSGFQLNNPLAKEKNCKVNKHVASQLSNEGFIFFRSLPESNLSIRNIWNFNIWYRRREWLTFIFLIIAGFFITACFPIFTQIIFDYVIPGRNSHLLIEISLGALALTFITLVFSYQRESLLLRLTGLIDYDMEMAVWQRLIQLPASFFRRHSLYDLFMFTSAVGSIRQLLSSQVIQVFLNAVFAIFFAALLFYYSKTLAIVGLAILTIELLAIVISIPFGIHYGKEIIDHQIETNNKTFEIIQGLSKIRLTAAEARFFHRWEQAFLGLKTAELKIMLLKLRMRTFSGFWSYTGTGLLFLFVVILLKSRAPSDVFETAVLSVGSFMAFMTTFSLLSSSIHQVIFTILKVVSIVPLWNKIKEFSKAVPEEYCTKSNPIPLKGEIRISTLSFGYQTDISPVLKEISIVIKPGTCVAFVGPSGCGKSTIIRLLMGFETAQQGSIYYDGQEIQGINMQLLRSEIGTVLQSSAIFDGTLLDNINSGRFYTKKEVLETFDLIGMSDFIDSLPMGVNTILTNSGTALSGGQRQLVLLARALIGKPKILILDEATSALDSQKQKIIFDNLSHLKITRLIITQRLDHLQKSVDHIYVMDQGRIVDQGTFTELVERSSFFAQFLSKQTSGQ